MAAFGSHLFRLLKTTFKLSQERDTIFRFSAGLESPGLLVVASSLPQTNEWT